jgi:hypothetical protein
MDTVEWSVALGMTVLAVGGLVYILIRLTNEPRTNLDPKSQRLARLLLYPRFLDPLLAKPMSRREKLGWLIVLALIAGAVAFTSLTGIGARG